MADIQGIPAPDTLPEAAIPPPPALTPSSPSTPSTPHPSISASKTPSLSALESWLPLYLAKTDRLVAHLHRILSTPSGIDSALLAIGYSSLAASTLLTSFTRARLHITILKYLKAISDLPAGTTLLIDTSLPAPRTLRAARSLEALSSLISDFRIFARLWGLLGIWRWGKSVLDAPPKDATLRGIAYTQVVANVLFQVLENGAYLASKGVLGWSEERQGRAWRWSSRFWAAHVGLEFLRLGREVRMRKGDSKEKKGRKMGEDGVDAAEERAVYEAWRRELVVNLAYAPLTMHWSLEGGLINPLTVGLLGSVVGAIKMKRLWKATA